jgi:hypothetical protein
MKMTIRPILLTLMLGLLLLTATYTAADMSLDQAVKQARQRIGGRVISAETRNQNGHQVHNIRILSNDGKVRRLQINANGDAGRNRGRR